MAEPSRENDEIAIPTGLPGPGIQVRDRLTNSYRKASSCRPTSYETHSVASQTQLEDPRITGKGDASIEGWGTRLDEHFARATWSPPGSKLHINYLELKAVFLALKAF